MPHKQNSNPSPPYNLLPHSALATASARAEAEASAEGSSDACAAGFECCTLSPPFFEFSNCRRRLGRALEDPEETLEPLPDNNEDEKEDGIPCAATHFSEGHMKCMGVAKGMKAPLNAYQAAFNATFKLVAQSFVDTVSAGLARVHVDVSIPAYYKNEIGNNDTFIFPEGSDEVEIDVVSFCG
jgi:hypothetical protein